MLSDLVVSVLLRHLVSFKILFQPAPRHRSVSNNVFAQRVCKVNLRDLVLVRVVGRQGARVDSDVHDPVALQTPVPGVCADAPDFFQLFTRLVPSSFDAHT